MPVTARVAYMSRSANHGHPHREPLEGDEDEDGLELPVNPDEGTPLVPDEEGEVQVPS